MITVEPKLKALLYSRIKDKECCMYGSGLDCIAIVIFFLDCTRKYMVFVCRLLFEGTDVIFARL